MPPRPLRSTRSLRDPRVTLITSDVTPVKVEPPSPSSASTYTSLRRATRSVVSSSSSRPVDLGSYAYKPTTPSPRKRVKRESPAAADREDDPLVKLEEVPLTPISQLAEAGPSRPLTPRSNKKPMPQMALAKPHPAPARWEEQYRLIERMRRGIVAPVDDMGCERPRTTTDADPKTLRFHILISLMLSSQTKDAVTSQAVTNLHITLPGGLTAESLAVASPETVQKCIDKVGFWRRKTEYIQEAARTLLERPGDLSGDVPDTIEGLCELKGVGPKMAFLALQCAWDINAGIGVDVHVHRITNRLKWHKPPTQTPEQTRLNLQSWLPPELHKPINPMLVGFGQVICLPVGPRCDICLLGKAKICPSRVANVKAEGRKEVVYTFTAEDEVKMEVIAGQQGSAKVEIGYEEEGVKQELLEPGMRRVDEVLEVLDEVDGAASI
ncbi:DNA N-glycosylase and apurinic/apyrimidinic (AP) lyase [Saitozyma podzolica]|uniref:Endonuclease III homolog n=1 Tax=Saitozyma podzolica TaxID=1890683 RepID=A0A427YT11_9TREE|nr:DNA N-glycosylase and apurinic/apyrimidinic (AP) lyase [Saitozyma podzolica]